MMELLHSLLPGTFNTRDLGGYALPEGGVTRRDILLRSDHLGRTGREDAALLAEWGIRSIIDLRRDDEVRKIPVPDLLQEQCVYVRLPVDNTPLFASRRNDSSFQLWELYAYMLEHQARHFAEAIHLIAGTLPHGVLFHCSAGKDRTGLLAALLLGCVGVSPDEIVMDYAATAAMLARKPPEEIATIPPDTDPDFYRMLLSCEGRHMEKFLALLAEKGGARNYLLGTGGVPADELDFVSACLTGRFTG